MYLKSLKESLPWLVPSAAIVFAGTGFLMSINSPQGPSVADRETVSAATTEQQIASLQAALDAALRANGEEEIVARQASGADVLTTSPSRAEPGLAKASPVTDPDPQSVDDRVVAMTTPHGAAKLFASGAAAREDAARCMDDLRDLTADAVVYFPDGGVEPDPAGIEQARLIGLVAQSCDGARIMVEGHSGASRDPATSRAFGERRAQQVIDRVAATGIDTSMFMAHGARHRTPSGVVGSESTASYDRRVEFSVVDPATPAAVRAPVAKPVVTEACVTTLEQAASTALLYYPPRSVSPPTPDVNSAHALARLAADCPQARLRIIGHHSGDAGAREDVQTGMQRALALEAMLVGRGIPSEQIAIAASTRPVTTSAGPGGLVSFDVLPEEG